MPRDYRKYVPDKVLKEFLDTNPSPEQLVSFFSEATLSWMEHHARESRMKTTEDLIEAYRSDISDFNDFFRIKKDISGRRTMIPTPGL